MKTRRFFAGNTLPQALMAAARYHGLSPDELAYRLRDKRHGFVTRVRRFIVEVDPAAPLRSRGEGRPATAPAVAPVAPAAPAASAPPGVGPGPAPGKPAPAAAAAAAGPLRRTSGDAADGAQRRRTRRVPPRVPRSRFCRRTKSRSWRRPPQ